MPDRNGLLRAVAGAQHRPQAAVGTIHKRPLIREPTPMKVDTRDIDGDPFHVDDRARDHILRVGLNRFAEAVVAKY